MIVGLTCACGGAVPLVRKAFRKAKLDNWLDIPVYEGKEGWKKFQEDLPDEYKTYGFGVLKTFIEENSTYALVIGISEKKKDLVFSRADGSIVEKLDAQVIAEQFA